MKHRLHHWLLLLLKLELAVWCSLDELLLHVLVLLAHELVSLSMCHSCACQASLERSLRNCLAHVRCAVLLRVLPTKFRVKKVDLLQARWLCSRRHVKCLGPELLRHLVVLKETCAYVAFVHLATTHNSNLRVHYYVVGNGKWLESLSQVSNLHRVFRRYHVALLLTRPRSVNKFLGSGRVRDLQLQRNLG